MTPAKVAMRLRQFRRQRGLTQQALAEKARLSLGYVARLEIGRHDPKLSTLAKIAKALGMTVSELLQ